LWLQKTGQIPDSEAGEAAYWGTQLEALVRSEFTKRTGIEVKLVSQLLQSEAFPFMLANLDGMCEIPGCGECIFEAKTSSAYKEGDWDDKIPDEYMLQIQHYMSVTGYKGTYIAVLIGGNTFRWKFIERDEELISMIVQLEDKFWKHVQNGTPPAIDGSEATAKFLGERFPNSTPLSKIDLPDNALNVISQYDNACEQLGHINEKKLEAENLLKQMIGEHEAGIVGNRIITWKNVSQERLDSVTLKAEHPTLYKKYSNVINHRRFSVKTIV